MGWRGRGRRRLEEHHGRIGHDVLDRLGRPGGDLDGRENDGPMDQERDDGLPNGFLGLGLGLDKVLEHATTSEGGVNVSEKVSPAR
jgi:hypothetical protein